MVQDLQALRFDDTAASNLRLIEPAISARAEAAAGRSTWERHLTRSIFATDAAMLALAVGLAHLLRYDVLSKQPIVGSRVLAFSVALYAVWLLSLVAFRTIDPKLLDAGSRQYQALARSAFAVFGWLAIATLMFKWNPSRGFITMAFAFGITFLFVERRAWRVRVNRGRRQGRYLAKVLIIGGVRSAKTMTLRFSEDAGSGFRVAGVWVPDRVAAPDERFHVGETAVPVMGTESDLGQALACDSVDTVVVTDTEHLGHDGMRELAWALEDRDVNLLVAPNVVDVAGPRIHLEAHGNMPLIYLSGPSYSRARTVRRALFDRTFAGLVLLASSPVWLAAMAAIKLTSRGPVFYRSERIGTHGVPFQMLKLRTMVHGADQQREELEHHNEGAGPLFKLRDDPRVTKVGRILRRYSIDEIPQFFNVLRGDMSVVGPRPPLRAEVDLYDEHTHRRLLVKQGVTGLWQVSGRSDLSWEDSVRLDLDYVENWTMLRDIQIIIRTARAVLASKGAY